MGDDSSSQSLGRYCSGSVKAVVFNIYCNLCFLDGGHLLLKTP